MIQILPASQLFHPGFLLVQYSVSPTKTNHVLSGYNVRLPGLGVLLVHPLLGLLKKAHGLLRLVRQVVDDHAEILILAEDLYFALIPGQNGA